MKGRLADAWVFAACLIKVLIRRPGTRAGLLALQERRWRHLRRRVLTRSPYYAALARRGARLEEFPVIDKRTMMANFDRINTAGVRAEAALDLAVAAERSRDFSPEIEGLTVGLSTGTSGHRGLFLVSRRERCLWAAAVLTRCLPRPWWRRRRVALVLRSGSNLYETAGRGRIRFAYFDLTLPFEALADRLAAYAPDLLVAPPSVLGRLARARTAGRLALAPAHVIAAAETLEPDTRTAVETAFGVRLAQIYQATEGFLGFTCGHGGFHLNEDLLIVERHYLDSDRTRFMPVLTDLSRHSQPVVRYRLDDILIAADRPCPCGSPLALIEKVEGRCDDVVALRPRGEPRAMKQVYSDFVRRAMALVEGPLEDYLIDQCRPGDLSVALDCPPAALPRLRAEAAAQLRRLAADFGCEEPHVAFADWPGRDPLAKLRRVRRHFPLDASAH